MVSAGPRRADAARTGARKGQRLNRRSPRSRGSRDSCCWRLEQCDFHGRTRVLTLTLHFAMKFSRGGARKVHTDTREPPGADVRTPHFHARRRKDQGPSARYQGLRRSRADPCYHTLFLATLTHRTLPRLRLHRLSDWLCSHGCGMEVCRVLPQRNCGRISRPSLLTRSFG